jgi:hypothetical protein
MICYFTIKIKFGDFHIYFVSCYCWQGYKLAMIKLGPLSGKESKKERQKELF